MRQVTDARFKKRVPCRVRLGASSYAGMVLNMSRTGMFIQTSAVPSRGDAVALTLRGTIPISGQVVWRRRVPPQLRSVAAGGMGLRIVSASEAYFGLLAEASGAEEARTPRDPASDLEPKPSELRYRARVQQDGGPRSRTVDVSAASEEDAARRVRAQLGPGWSVVQIDRRSQDPPAPR